MNDSTPQISQPQTKEIPLTQGKVAVVDAADYEWLMQWKWSLYTSRKSRTSYAQRSHRVNGKQHIMFMHRQILTAKKGVRVDHKDGDGLNNTRENLRLASHKDNMQNVQIHIDNTSGYKGVTWHKHDQKWQAQIRCDGEYIYLGQYTDAEIAARVYDAAARELHGEFARTNFED